MVLANARFNISEHYLTRVTRFGRLGLRGTMTNEGVENKGQSFPWEIGVYDAHCHPTDTMASVEDIPNMKATAVTTMATRAEDQDLVFESASRYGVKEKGAYQGSPRKCIIPAFGWHPWFSHQIYDDLNGDSHDSLDKVEHYKSVLTPKPQEDSFLLSLPDPRPLSAFLNETEARLKQFPLALIGEVGLDRAFRIPSEWLEHERPLRDSSLTPGSREGRTLSPHRVLMNHQKQILKAQLQLAGKLRRPVSVHSVQAHGAVFELLEELWKGHKKEVVSKRTMKRRGSAPGAHDPDEKEERTSSETPKPLPYPPRVCMHSYSGPADPLKQFLHPSVPADIFFSFSTAINFSNPSIDKITEVIKTVPESNILIESDLHCAGDQMDSRLEEIAREVCSIKGWELEDGLHILKSNWERFVFDS